MKHNRSSTCRKRLDEKVKGNLTVSDEGRIYQVLESKTPRRHRLLLNREISGAPVKRASTRVRAAGAIRRFSTAAASRIVTAAGEEAEASAPMRLLVDIRSQGDHAGVAGAWGK